MIKRTIFPRGAASRFRVGQRVRIVGSVPARHDTVSEVIQKAHRTRYRLAESEFLYFESDIQEAE